MVVSVRQILPSIPVATSTSSGLMSTAQVIQADFGARHVGGVGAVRTLTAAWLSDVGVTGDPTVTAATQGYGLPGAFTVVGSPQRQANGLVRMISNGVTSNDNLNISAVEITPRTALVLDVHVLPTGTWSGGARLINAADFIGGHGFFISSAGLNVMSAASTAMTIDPALTAGRQLIGLYLDITADPATYRLLVMRQDAATSRASGSFSGAGADPTGQTVLLSIGNDASVAGRIGTHDFAGFRLLTNIPASLSADEIDGMLLAEMRMLSRDDDPRLRERPAGPSYQGITSAQAVSGYTIVRESNEILHELTEDLTAAGTSTLPADARIGDVVTLSRKGGGFFDWTETVTDTELGYRDDHIVFQLVAANTWKVLYTRANGRIGVRRRGTGSYEGDLSETRTRQVFTAAASYNIGAALGASTGFSVDLVQQSSGQVTLTVDGGLTKIPSAAPLITNGIGSALHVEAIGNSQVWIYLVNDPSVGAGEAVAGGTFVPTAIAITARQTIYSPYTQTGAVAPALAASTFHGGTAVVLWTANNAGSGQSSTITWGASLVAGETGLNADLPATLPAGPQRIMFSYNETLNVGEVYFARATIASISGLQTALDAKAPAANPVFTGTVTIPDGALAIADTSGLQTALDAKLALAGGTMTGAITLGTSASIVGGDKLASALELKDIAETPFNLGTGPTNAALNVDYSNGGYQYVTTGAGNITVVIVTNWPASGKVGSLTLEITQGATPRTITWGGSHRFVGGTDATLTASAGAVDIFTLITRDAGSTIYVFEGGKGFAA